MILNTPLAIWFGALTFIFLILTFSFGIAFHVFRKNVFNLHKIFAFVTLILAIIHVIFALMLWFSGIVI